MHKIFHMPAIGLHTNAELARDQEVNQFTLRLYLETLWRFRRWALTIVCTSVVTTACFSALLPYFLAEAIELVSHRVSLLWGGPLAMTITIAFAVAALGTIGVFVGVRNFAQLDIRAQTYLRGKIFERLTHESAAFYANTMTGSLTGNLNSYLVGYAIVQELVITRGPQLIVPLVVGMGLAASQSWLLAGMFLLITLLVALKTLIDSRHRAPYRRARKEAVSQVNGFVADVLSNTSIVRAFAGEAIEGQSLKKKLHTWSRACFLNLAHFGRHSAILQGSVNTLQVAGVAFAAWLVMMGAIDLGLAIFAITYFQRLGSSLYDLAPAVQAYQGAMTDSAPISEILMAPQEVTEFEDARELRVRQGEILIKDITYRYEEHVRPVFHDLSLYIPPGQRVGIVGHSGGGKTTLTHLLLRFADVEHGSIKIEDQDIAEVTLASLRRSIAYVPQDSQLFHRSLRENIAYGKPDAAEQEIISAAKKAHIWQLITTLPKGLDTLVGERGLKLSGGQRQRVAIARAILKDAPILVLDEATSALDSESEKYIQAALQELMKGRTTIAIAHRLSTIQEMERIIVLEKGKIVEDGSHASLLKKKGVYASLWAHQSGGFIEE